MTLEAERRVLQQLSGERLDSRLGVGAGAAALPECTPEKSRAVQDFNKRSQKEPQKVVKKTHKKTALSS